MTPDVNVLVAAFRADHTHHASARSWLDQARRTCLAGRTSLTLLPVVVTGFLRLVTNPRVFVQPDAIEDAVAFVDALLASTEARTCGSSVKSKATASASPPAAIISTATAWARSIPRLACTNTCAPSAASA